MLATSRMWRSTRWTHAVWWRQLRAGAPAGGQWLERPRPLEATFRRGGLRRTHAFCSRPIRRWPCLIRSDQGVAAVEPVAAAVAEAVVEAVVRGVEGRAAVVVRVVPVEVVAQEAAVKAAPAVEERVAPAAAPAVAAARGAAPGVAVPILSLTTAVRPTASHGRSCRHSHLRPRPTSRSWQRWPKERGVSQSSIPTTYWVDSSASGASKTSSTYWVRARRHAGRELPRAESEAES